MNNSYEREKMDIFLVIKLKYVGSNSFILSAVDLFVEDFLLSIFTFFPLFDLNTFNKNSRRNQKQEKVHIRDQSTRVKAVKKKTLLLFALL